MCVQGRRIFRIVFLLFEMKRRTKLTHLYYYSSTLSVCPLLLYLCILLLYLPYDD
jgi:hypothetical protein